MQTKYIGHSTIRMGNQTATFWQTSQGEIPALGLRSLDNGGGKKRLASLTLVSNLMTCRFWICWNSEQWPSQLKLTY